MRWLVLALLGGCTVAAEPAVDGDRLAPLRAFEAEHRQATDFAALPPAERALGPEPVDLVDLGSGRWAGVLVGDDAVALIDGAGVELTRTDAPALPQAIAVDGGGRVWVGGGASLELRGYTRDGDRLIADRTALAGAAGEVADLATDGDTVYVADRAGGRVLAIDGAGDARDAIACRGPRRLAATAGWLVAACVLDRSLVARTPAGAIVTIDHDAPLVAVAAVEDGGELVVAAGGMEDHPLDRTDGGFGNIDSFLFVYRMGAAGAQRIATVNLSELDVVTPSAIELLATAGGGLAAQVIGAGGGHRASLSWPTGTGEPEVATSPLPPGITAAAGALAADPLLDAWITLAGEPAIARVAGADRVAPEVRLGEALYATTAIAPWNDSAGSGSRFTCQSCHVDGYSDGRTHYTGRDDIHATTRAIRGLFNNRPHFSRALDRTLADMVDSEVSVMNRHSGRSPWFTLRASDVPWLRELGVDEVDPVALREALMAFLMVYTHAPNPAAASRTGFSATEARGATLFAATCERCHAARLSADDPASRIAFEDWEPLIMSERGPIVWGSDAYQQTGVEPYVHPAGSRVPSLRRLGRKWPYFTNGTASDLPELIARARVGGTAGFAHDGGDGIALTADQQAAVLAFLDLL